MAQAKSHFVNSSSGLDPHLPTTRPPRKRHPLSDATNWINNSNRSMSPPNHSSAWEPSSPYDPSSDPPSSIPHHSSLHPGGTLQHPNLSSSSPSKPEDKRVSAVSSEEARASARLSQISQTSTNASNTNGKGRRKTHVGPWRLGRTIGKGASGRVRKARHAVTGQDAAIKIVSKKSAEFLRSQSLAFIDAKVDQGRQRAIPVGIEREVVIMKMIEHPNIIRLFDIWENRGELYLVLELVEGGELFNHISSKGGLPEHEAVRIFRQIIAALAYCHQFNICHRDLKPENILLDRNKNIKIVDFGMAALQPANKWLETPCGSPHYASPEVIRAEPYRGDKADIWSCGVILFAMLAGFLPFDAHTEDWRDVIHTVLACDYKIPEWLSSDAQDLIYRILQPEPHKRMSIKHMWNHPLVKKYAHLDSLDEDGESHIGPPPGLTIQDCGARIKHRSDIDGELLRNLHDLWHGASEDELSQKLLSEEPNHEKIVYSKLLRYREEQLEHYDGPPLEASMSDHHHITTSNKMYRQSPTEASMKFSQGQRQQSQYSLADHHLQLLTRRGSLAVPRRHASVAETEKTAESYDPFRPSRNHIARSQAGPMRVTVLREASQTSQQRQSTNSIADSSPKSTTIHIPQPHEEEEAYSIPSSPPTADSPGAFHFQRMLASQRRLSRGNSKVTMGSVCTGRSGSFQIVARKRASYKRNVSFNHRGRGSMSSNQPRLRSREHQPQSKTLQERYVRDKAHRRLHASSSPPSSPALRDSPMPEVQPLVRSRKEGGGKATATSLRSKLHSDTNWTDDVRKISTELDKLCDNAFNRVSMSSSAPTAITPGSGNRASQGRNPSSATSFSIFEDPVSEIDDRHVRMKMKDVSTQADEMRLRTPTPPLPPTMDPMAQNRLGSYAQRELAKTRDLLSKRNRASYMEPGYLDDVIAHLDRLMQPSNVRLVDEERRAITDPSSNALPRKDTFEQIMEIGDIGFRSASEPTRDRDRDSGKRSKHRTRDQTIRVVEDTSHGYKPLSPIKPLTIRKKSGTSSSTPSPTTPTNPPLPIDSSRALPNTRSTGPTLQDRSLDPIKETEDLNATERIRQGDDPMEQKKRSWFRSQPQPQVKPLKDVKTGPAPPAKEQQQVYDRGQEQKLKHISAASDESRVSESKKRGKGGGNFFKKMFTTGKRDVKTIEVSSGGDYLLNDTASFDTEESFINANQRSRDLQPGIPAAGGSAQYRTGSSTGSTVLRKKSHHHKHAHNGKDRRTTAPSSFLPPPPPPDHDLYLPPNQTLHPNNPNNSNPLRHRASNWLARILGIKPATHVLCFHLSKFHARREIAGVFRDWRRFGMRDVVVDKVACTVRARVDAVNSLNIPPLTLSVQTHTLLHHGRRANLSIARFVQERGAKSSFEKVVRALEGVLRERGVVVEEDGVVGDMRRGAGM